MEFVTERVLPLTLTLAIRIFAVSSMLMVGLRYTIGDLARPLRDITGVAIALVTNFILVPLLAVVLLRTFPLDTPYATGLIIVACAGGAPLLVKLAMNAKEDVGFAASLIVLLLAGTIVAMPLIMPMFAEGARVSAWAIARPLLITMFLPLIIGFVSRPLLPTLAQRAVPDAGNDPEYRAVGDGRPVVVSKPRRRHRHSRSRGDFRLDTVHCACLRPRLCHRRLRQTGADRCSGSAPLSATSPLPSW